MVGKFFKSYYIHIIIWLLLLFFPFVNYLYEPEKIKDFDPYLAISHFCSIGYLAMSFYLLLNYAAPKYFFRRRLKFVLFVLLGLTAYIAVNYLIVHFNPTNELERLRKEDVLFVRIFVGPTIIYFLCTIIGNMLFFYNEQARQKALNKQIELEKTTAELNLLKLQISPHFLFNTLNNIRWQVRKEPEASEESILKLSEMLRYIIYEVEHNRVELLREIEHVKNFMELQSLRLPIAGHVVLDVQEGLKNCLIHPLLFIHFVENAFKYGVDSQTPPFIHFEFVEIDGGIGFRSRNSILIPGTNRVGEGIGLANIRRRLELLYPNNYMLRTEQNEGYFDVTLNLYIDEN